MPFSTYLNDPKPGEPRTGQLDAHEQQQQHYQGDFTFPQSSPFPAQDSYQGYSPSDAMRQFSSYYAGPAPTNSPISTNSSAGPSSSGSVASTSSTGKPFFSSSPTPRSAGGSGPGFFQMPAFLMGGGYGGTLAPGGGAEVINPSIYDYVSTPFVPSFDNGKPWPTSKFTASEQKPALERRDDVEGAGAGSSHVHAHASAASGSPFGYLNADSPQEHPPAPVSAQDEGADEPAANMNVAQVEIADSGGGGGDGTEGALSMHSNLFAAEPNADLPLYSQSGFDMLSILGRVAMRPNPTIKLGPVDLTCAFVVADVRRNDSPIVYASRTFCDLTGYAESDILGRNCRFLQAPGGRVTRSEARRFTSAEAVRELWLALDKDREVQVSLINYRKDGKPFVNRVSIVPIPADDGSSEIAFHVGFQVDLNEQPGLIAQRIQDGKFYSNPTYGGSIYGSLRTQTPAERSARAMGQKLRALLADPTFQTTTPLNTTCNNAPSTASSNSNSSLKETDHSSVPKPSLSNRPDPRDERQWLNLLLLEHMPDFVHVLSLKGHFLYVSPAITRVLGYSPADLIGKSVGDFCHPSDAVPLLRELKESTGQLSSGPAESAKAPLSSDAHEVQTTHMGQRTVDVLFRMRTKAGGYMWIESIGRLHIEAGKGRKAIVLSGRSCALPNLRWGAISQAGGIIRPSPRPSGGESGETAEDVSSTEREFWAMLCEDGLFLVAGMGARDMLGWGAAEMIGRSIREFIIEGEDGASAEQVLTTLGRAYNAEMDTQSLNCHMKRRDGEIARMQLILYANESRSASGRIIVQFKLLPLTSSSSPVSPFPSYSPTTFQNTHYQFLPPHASSSSHPMLSPSTSVSAKPGRISHAPSSNVFSEFETHRGTSWQYELQQLKYANDKLREEIAALETRRRGQHRTPW